MTFGHLQKAIDVARIFVTGAGLLLGGRGKTDVIGQLNISIVLLDLGAAPPRLCPQRKHSLGFIIYR